MFMINSCPSKVRVLSVSRPSPAMGAVGVIFMEAMTSVRGCKVLGCCCGVGSMDLSNSFSSAAMKQKESGEIMANMQT